MKPRGVIAFLYFVMQLLTLASSSRMIHPPAPPIKRLRTAPFLTNMSTSVDGRVVALRTLNIMRGWHGAPGLVRDRDIEDFSNSWSEYLLASGEFKHSTSQYGENLALLSYNGNVTQMLELAMKLWYAEISVYNYTRPVFSSSTGHFTALVWRDTRKVGIGYAINTQRRRGIVCFSFWPPGNVAGAFVRNVLPPRGFE